MIITTREDNFRMKLMKIGSIVILCSFIFTIMLVFGLMKYGILIVVGVIVLILFIKFKKKKRRFHPRNKFHRHKTHRYHRYHKNRRR